MVTNGHDMRTPEGRLRRFREIMEAGDLAETAEALCRAEERAAETEDSVRQCSELLRELETRLINRREAAMSRPEAPRWRVRRREFMEAGRPWVHYTASTLGDLIEIMAQRPVEREAEIEPLFRSLSEYPETLATLRARVRELEHELAVVRHALDTTMDLPTW
jgi:hypothetical protein